MAGPYCRCQVITRAGRPEQLQLWLPSNQISMKAIFTSPLAALTSLNLQALRIADHINYGDNGSGTLTTNGLAAGMALPGPGYYELVCNPVTLTWSYTLVTWGILGDATPGGWNTDTQLTYDPAKQVWTVTCEMSSAGSFKFRANNAWSIDFGIDGNNQLQYADNPAYPYNGTLNNLTVPSSGNYTITLDLHDPNNYTYTLHKNQ